MTIPDRSIRVSADRGGTFTDIIASFPKNGKHEEIVVKLLSQDPNNYADAPTEGIRRVIEIATGESIPRGQKVPSKKLDNIRLSTTVATNSLLERKGEEHALLITKGFKDLLEIGNQSRPKIFDLSIKRPSTLYNDVIEVDERVTLVGYTQDPESGENAVQFDAKGRIARGYRGKGWDGQGDAEGPGDVVMGVSGEAVRILKRPDLAVVRQDLQRLYKKGIRSLAIVFVHSYTYPKHEQEVADLARSIGFTHVSASSQLLSMIKMVPRGVSATADAYLTPVLSDYINGFFHGFDDAIGDGSGADGGCKVEFMGSDGGLLDLRNFSGLKAILSGPAGGVVGYALTSWDEKARIPVIGLDIGGTSTDVSRFAGAYETVYETTTAGVSIQSPQLDINTVAAGGGSCLTFRDGLFHVGPHSAGAHPGPACYKKGGPLAVTDANLFLGRLVPSRFPRVFGPNENEPIDPSASAAAFGELERQIKAETNAEHDLDAIVYGYLKIANETMARPIRTLTEAKGHATWSHILAAFGGAGGQSAAEIAQILKISRVVIHKYSSILSAFGLSLANRTFEKQLPSSKLWNQDSKPEFTKRLDELAGVVKQELNSQGFDNERITLERYLNMRFDGSDTTLMITTDSDEHFHEAFKERYMDEFGFLLESDIMVDDVKVKGIGKTYDQLGESALSEYSNLKRRPLTKKDADSTQPSYFEIQGKGQRVETPVYVLDNLQVGDTITGPAIVIDNTQTIVVLPDWIATSTTQCLFLECEKLKQ
ncbi:hypothetical protein E3P86_02850 [Wallemia ichthyophaga]|uniref:5-oxoprolinase n=1 Tax=Wallemia ichthyophaga TaxID=245174 RepID=A0A4T0J3H5_WALIC|nr:hypothetical protein E3P86_02850 [Wallemia ichthyophaga]